VRHLADQHLLAMTHPAAKGERFIGISGHSLWMADVAEVLRRRMGAAASKVPTQEIPNWVIRLLALRGDPTTKMLAKHLGVMMDATSEKATRLLGWMPRPAEEAIVATAESLLRLGLVGGSKAAV
jgi:dihydroflavonol-4-reductase